ncbi:hypothetical protein VB620_06180 [Nodularia harveyana UHCC-0300]|uniref:Uncharacterized protein n=1 Tax=Nodularia harveyana UHCC-0300 TaxID=2974287 RepID=A0ABU5UD48_9CYAN|nr:hypothetical protein [Nodularia harveyana]MEA5580926.1 hypothetical protein [Nodularia harveyana UHCC-0300]
MDNPASQPDFGSKGNNFDISGQTMAAHRRITGQVLTILTMVFASVVVIPLLSIGVLWGCDRPSGCNNGYPEG